MKDIYSIDDEYLDKDIVFIGKDMIFSINNRSIFGFINISEKYKNSKHMNDDYTYEQKCISNLSDNGYYLANRMESLGDIVSGFQCIHNLLILCNRYRVNYHEIHNIIDDLSEVSTKMIITQSDIDIKGLKECVKKLNSLIDNYDNNIG